MRIRTMSALFSAIILCGVTVAHAAGGRQDDAKADPAAFALLKEAHDRRDTFPAGFSGLTADVLLNDNGKEVKGALTYTSAGEVKLTLTDATKQEEEWANEELGSALAHRRKDDFAHGDGSHPLTFVQDDHSPLGRLIALNDRFKSAYRVKDGQITEVTRSMGKIRFTITVLDNKFVEDGKYLPNQFVVTYFDASSGAIQHVDLFSDGFVKVGNAWIPSSRRVVTAENGSFTTRSLALTNIHLLGSTTAAK
jgi:hypothetical protein